MRHGRCKYFFPLMLHLQLPPSTPVGLEHSLFNVYSLSALGGKDRKASHFCERIHLVKYFLTCSATSAVKTLPQAQDEPRKPLSTTRMKYHKLLNSLLRFLWRRPFTQNWLTLIFRVILTVFVFVLVCSNMITEEGPPQAGVVTPER